MELLEYEDQGKSLDCTGFIDATYNLKKLAPLPAEYTQPSKVYRSSDEYFAPLCRYNYKDLDFFFFAFRSFPLCKMVNDSCF